ncbi:MAG: VWA domain-containing protein [Verrucomicrobiales bacterium]
MKTKKPIIQKKCHLKPLAYLLIILALTIALKTGPALAEVTKANLDETRTFTHDGVDFTITYTDTPGDADRVSATDIDNVEAFTKDSYDSLVEVMGFRTPWLSTLPDFGIFVHDIAALGSAHPDCFELDAPMFSTSTALAVKKVLLHEMFHTVQRNYKDSINGGSSGYIGSTFGKWVSEGTAVAIEDKSFAEIDDFTGHPFYEGDASDFLTSPDETLFDKSYDCGLWWNYLMEQLGTNKVDPNYGTEFMVAFWDKLVTNDVDAPANSKPALEELLASRGRSLENVFHDFTICNYTREFDVTGIPDASKYSYIDEQTQPITSDVPKTTVAIPGNGVTAVNPWAAEYIEADVGQGSECFAVGFKAVSTGDTMAFTVVATDSAGSVIGIKRAIGTEFAGVFFSEPTRPVEKICGIIGGLEEGGTVNWDFDAGQPKVEIIRPTFSRYAHPGSFDSPGNIVVTTKVTGLPALAPDGPDNPSILGLEKDYFTVRIGAEDAEVLDAAYVGGLWELVVAAPVQPADGLYNLDVNLCPGIIGGATATQRQAVLYGDLVFHHAVVLDISGSMESPTSAKLDAAKQAAKFYIDSVDDDDKFTVVSFSGDGVECNEDATNLKGSPGLLNGTTLARGLMKLAVDTLNSQQTTSIGDGLWAAQDALDAAASPDAIDTILLLTDGKENESRYWDSSKNPDGCGSADARIIPAATIVNTRAFGDGAETDLLQEIAAVTLGDYLYNPVESDGGAAKDAAPDFATMRNQLTLRFLAGLEHSKKLQRISLEKEEIAANDNAQIILNQPYDEVSAPLIYVGWSAATAMDVSVQTPDGQDLAAISQVYKEDTHIIFHPKDPLIGGNYVFTLAEKSGNDVEIFCGISGKPGNALDFFVSLSPVKNGGIFGRREHSRERFEHGMPVDINLAAMDLRGPVRDLEVSVEVTMPNGEPACPKPLAMPDDGAHQDGSHNDGRYGIRYTRTPFAGSNVVTQDRSERAKIRPGTSGTYQVVIHARGKDNFGAIIDQTFEKAFQVFERFESGNGDGDQDDDGMSDSWEVFYGTNPRLRDADIDMDQDGLRNIDEFFAGTHPGDPDNDNGGTADGYELSHGLCPLSPEDDPFPNLATVAVITTSDIHGHNGNLKSDALLLHFPDHPVYSRMEVYRGTASGFSSNAATLVHTIPMDGGLVTSFYDEGLQDGKRYFYKFRALSTDGSAATAFSREVSGVARHNPAEPFGTIVLNSKQRKTDRKELAVQLLSGGTAIEYRLSEAAFDGTEPWIALPDFGSIVPFTLNDPSLTDGSLAKVYFQFRSAAGVESHMQYVTIILDSSSNNDGDVLPDGTDPDDDGDGISDHDELFVHWTNPYSRDSDGDGYQDNEELGAGSDPADFDSAPDSDDDGFNDKLENLLGSDPDNPLSLPDIGLEIVTNDTGSQVSFNTIAGITYRLHTRSDLTSRVRDWQVVADPVEGTGSRETVVLPLANDRDFYAVSYQLAPAP